MPRRIQTDPERMEKVLNMILDTRFPPVARMRLLSSGFSEAHTLDIKEDITGTKACLGCGNCIDICPVLAREPMRKNKTQQRTSMALETLVGEDCDRCYACVLSCPQVDTTIKYYIVNRRNIEIMGRMEGRLIEDELDLDLFFEEAGGL